MPSTASCSRGAAATRLVGWHRRPSSTFIPSCTGRCGMRCVGAMSCGTWPMLLTRRRPRRRRCWCGRRRSFGRSWITSGAIGCMRHGCWPRRPGCAGGDPWPAVERPGPGCRPGGGAATPNSGGLPGAGVGAEDGQGPPLACPGPGDGGGASCPPRSPGRGEAGGWWPLSRLRAGVHPSGWNRRASGAVLSLVPTARAGGWAAEDPAA